MSGLTEFAYAAALAALTGLTLHALRGGLRGATVTGFDPQSLGLGALAVLAAGWLWGPLFGAALIVAVVVHEFGHVAAHRVMGHVDARFRLVPLMGGVTISDRLPATQAQDFFIVLLGPGISVAPMGLAYALSALTWDLSEGVSDFLYVLGIVMAVLNLFNLMPFWPLDGGRLLRILAYRIHPELARQLTFAMSAALGVWGLLSMSTLLVIFALLGATSAIQADGLARAQRAMDWRQWGWALAAYLACFAAHLAGAWGFIGGWF
ncbi:metalloprotease [Rhodobacter sp. SGA-6-6]|uniref:metalloprotease n=1 Tax=Rhodobacter sp. SGA-6-6 TaxID=2710882 RepID=UPI0013EAECDB|nr:site-2 protease family protein [Rhodobacter sp. SGA-6-6]NGM45447.1 metalloprotease [Rhodobacter sp. SGA-6-6]